MPVREVPSRVSANSPNPIQDMESYREIYAKSMSDSQSYWLSVTRDSIAWRKSPTISREGDFSSVVDAPLQWFSDGLLNVTESCLDRHVETHPDKIAILWEGDEPNDIRRISYRELHSDVCRFANGLLSLGI